MFDMLLLPICLRWMYSAASLEAKEFETLFAEFPVYYRLNALMAAHPTKESIDTVARSGYTYLLRSALPPHHALLGALHIDRLRDCDAPCDAIAAGHYRHDSEAHARTVHTLAMQLGGVSDSIHNSGAHNGAIVFKQYDTNLFLFLSVKQMQLSVITETLAHVILVMHERKLAPALVVDCVLRTQLLAISSPSTRRSYSSCRSQCGPFSTATCIVRVFVAHQSVAALYS